MLEIVLAFIIYTYPEETPSEEGGVLYCQTMVSYLRSQYTSTEDLESLLDQKSKLFLDASAQVDRLITAPPKKDDYTPENRLKWYSEESWLRHQKDLYKWQRLKFLEYAPSIDKPEGFCEMRSEIVHPDDIVYPDQIWLVDNPVFGDPRAASYECGRQLSRRLRNIDRIKLCASYYVKEEILECDDPLLEDIAIAECTSTTPGVDNLQ